MAAEPAAAQVEIQDKKRARPLREYIKSKEPKPTDEGETDETQPMPSDAEIDAAFEADEELAVSWEGHLLKRMIELGGRVERMEADRNDLFESASVDNARVGRLNHIVHSGFKTLHQGEEYNTIFEPDVLRYCYKRTADALD
jgi:hypothetical protein